MLTHAVSNVANITATLKAAAHSLMVMLDIKNIFFMVPLKEEDKEKFPFIWKGIHFTFSRLPQRYKYSPKIFHATLAELLQRDSLAQDVKL